MKIAHIGTESTWRGGEQQIYLLIKGLAQRGHESLAVVRKNGALAQRLKAEDLCPVIEICPWGEWDLFAAHKIRRELQARSIDIVHAHTGHAVAFAALATRGTKIPFVLTRRVDFRLARNPFSRWKYQKAAHILCVTSDIKRILVEDGIPEEKLTVAYSGLDFSRLQDIQPVRKEEMGIPADFILIGQASALAPHKNQVTLIKAIHLLHQQHSKIRCVLVGDGPVRLILEKLIAQLGLNDIVKLVGFREDALRFVKAFDYFCLSSIEEGIAICLAEAMFLGVPVIGTRAGGIPEVIEDGVTGYLAPKENPERLAEVLLKAIQHPADTERCRRAALEKSKLFDIASTVSKTEAVYKKIFLPMK